MKYIEYTISEIKKKIKDNEESKGRTIVRIQTKSDKPEARLVAVLEVGEDYIIARGRRKTELEVFSIGGISSWRFAEHQKSEWTW